MSGSPGKPKKCTDFEVDEKQNQLRIPNIIEAEQEKFISSNLEKMKANIEKKDNDKKSSLFTDKKSDGTESKMTEGSVSTCKKDSPKKLLTMSGSPVKPKKRTDFEVDEKQNKLRIPKIIEAEQEKFISSNLEKIKANKEKKDNDKKSSLFTDKKSDGTESKIKPLLSSMTEGSVSTCKKDSPKKLLTMSGSPVKPKKRTDFEVDEKQNQLRIPKIIEAEQEKFISSNLEKIKANKEKKDNDKKSSLFTDKKSDGTESKIKPLLSSMTEGSVSTCKKDSPKKLLTMSGSPGKRKKCTDFEVDEKQNQLSIPKIIEAEQEKFISSNLEKIKANKEKKDNDKKSSLFTDKKSDGTESKMTEGSVSTSKKDSPKKLLTTSGSPVKPKKHFDFEVEKQNQPRNSIWSYKIPKIIEAEQEKFILSNLEKIKANKEIKGKKRHDNYKDDDGAYNSPLAHVYKPSSSKYRSSRRREYSSAEFIKRRDLKRKFSPVKENARHFSKQDFSSRKSSLEHDSKSRSSKYRSHDNYKDDDGAYNSPLAHVYKPSSSKYRSSRRREYSSAEFIKRRDLKRKFSPVQENAQHSSKLGFSSRMSSLVRDSKRRSIKESSPVKECTSKKSSPVKECTSALNFTGENLEIRSSHVQENAHQGHGEYVEPPVQKDELSTGKNDEQSLSVPDNLQYYSSTEYSFNSSDSAANFSFDFSPKNSPEWD